MIRLYLGHTELTFSFWFFAVVALFALTDRATLLFYLLLPVGIHEAGHLAAMAVCGVRVRGVRFTAFGVDIRRDSGCMIGYGKELAVSLGGVAANAAVALALHAALFHTMRVMLLVAANLAVAIFNLLPIGDLDGGQVVRLLTARWLSPDLARAVSRGTSLLVLALLFGFAIFLLLARLGNPTLLLICGYLAVTVILRE